MADSKLIDLLTALHTLSINNQNKKEDAMHKAMEDVWKGLVTIAAGQERLIEAIGGLQ